MITPLSKPQKASNKPLTPIERCAIRFALLQGYSRSDVAIMLQVTTTTAQILSKGLPRPAPGGEATPESRAVLCELTRIDLGAASRNSDLVEAAITEACELLAGRIAAQERSDRRRSFTVYQNESM